MVVCAGMCTSSTCADLGVFVYVAQHTRSLLLHGLHLCFVSFTAQRDVVYAGRVCLCTYLCRLDFCVCLS
jgi:hypothetical protein